MYQKLTFEQQELIKKVENITNTDYELLGDFIQTELLIHVIEDMLCEYEEIQEKYEDYKQYVKDNYREISQSDQYDICEDWFH